MMLSARLHTTSAPLECEAFECKSGREATKSLCPSCGSTYCDVCWDRQGPHKPGKVGLDNLPHEKTDKQIYDRLKVILEPPEDTIELSRLHVEDEDTTWFAVEKDSSGQPIFQDYGRYPALMAETKQPNAGIRYPQLVSFVGQTGAGKSTLIKMLVSLKEQRLSFSSTLPFRSPVVGSVKNDKSPTSGDVHLYVDPDTAYGPLPLLYADCEGLEGGETAPRAHQLRETMRNSEQGPKRQRLFGTRPRELVYAKKNSEARNREWAVRKVYPRLLYTFSDVVVFVLRNTRAFESTALKLLLEWASTSLEFSVNQPTLPHAIIVLNASSTSVDEDEWDTSTATERLMQHVAYAVHEVPMFKNCAEDWRKRGTRIHNMLDLFRCYYADICVIRIPTKGRYMLADTQINKLHHKIVQNCDASFRAKNDAHMLSNADELNTYLQAGFDHFATKEDQPFNFVEVALKNNPIPRDFGDHILGIAAEVRKVTEILDGPALFKKLSFMIASCIFIDCIRQRRPGMAADLFDQFYAGSCTVALEHFCDKYWPCSFVSKKGKPCVNVKSSHSAKGHQNARGKIISAGKYKSQFSSSQFSPMWKNMIKDHLQRMERQFAERKSTKLTASYSGDDATAYDLHRRRIESFYSSFEHFTALSFNSLTTCYSCLMEVPQHPLRCGHTLCTACIRAYGRPNDRISVLMDYCPMHANTTRNKRSWIVHFKPDYAGVRVLTLDGGGIRGIVELEVLRAVEKALGGSVSIQAFFDLVVGTSTGGIIALGLGVKQWTLNQCVTEFIRLCDQAFTPREFDKVAGLKQATTLKHGSKYKTQPLQNALRQVFGEEQLYGGPRKAYYEYDTKVAVTATSGTGQRAVVLANYSRQEENEPNYKFEFPHHLQIWEAASATSAAPSLFKPFESQGKHIYLDGAVYYNNPVKVANNERKFLWPDVADAPPDIILSIGTGMNRHKIAEELENDSTERSVVRRAKPQSARKFNRLKIDVSAKSFKIKPFKLVKKYFQVLVNRIDKILDSEREWRQFCADVLDGKHSRDDISRYVRINVDLGEDPPALDDKTKLADVQAKTTRILKSSEYQSMIEKVAHRLIASTFYFLKDDRIEFDEASHLWTCTGKIVCRFEGKSIDSSHNMRSLGEFLRIQQGQSFQPFFSIKEKADDPDLHKIEISQSTIEDMIARAEFRFDNSVKIEVASQLSPIMIYLGLRETQRFELDLHPVSGFPRCLVTEDMVNATRLDKRAELIRERRYNALPVANDPKVAYPSDEVAVAVADSQIAEYEDTNIKAPNPIDAETKKKPPNPPARLASSSSNPSSSSANNKPSARPMKRSISVDDLRARSRIVSNATFIDAETLSKSDMALIEKTGAMGSDEEEESDGPPSDFEGDE